MTDAFASTEDMIAEQTVLGAVLVDPDLFVVATELLGVDDFSRPKHRTIYAALSAMFVAGEALDTVVLVAHLRRAGKLDGVGGPAYIASLTDGVPRATNVAHYAAIVAERALARELVRRARGIIADVAESGDQAPALLDRAEQSVFELASMKRSRRGFEPAQETARAAFEALRAVYDPATKRGIAYGLTDLDAMTCGMQPSDLVIVAARPSVGKSAFALHIARMAAKRGEQVGFLSLEMSKAALGLRLLGADGDVDVWRVMNGFATDMDWQKIEDSSERIATLPLWIDDSPTATILELRARARRLKAEHGLGLLLVDYLQLLTGKRQENRQQEVSDLSRSLKGLARDLDIPVVALSQLKRTEDRPKLSDLRESGAIEQDADTVIALYRPDTGDPSDPGEVEAILLKQRQGPTGTVRVFFNPGRQRFDDLAKDEMVRAD